MAVVSFELPEDLARQALAEGLLESEEFARLMQAELDQLSAKRAAKAAHSINPRSSSVEQTPPVPSPGNPGEG